MRDILIVSIVALGALTALRKPWVGIMLWTWLSIMNPHRYAFGFAYDAPLAAVAAVSTAVGILLNAREFKSPFKGSPAVVLVIFMAWMTISWVFGVDPRGDYPQWNKVMKIDVMIIIALALLRTKRHIFALMWVAVGSLALLGLKGGLFTLTTGGGLHVFGPPGSFIEDNNEFALALVMTVPLLRFLQMQVASSAGKHALTAVMVFCAAAALGSQSRGALLAIIAMGGFLWWRSKSRLAGGLVIVVSALALIAFMPDSWTQRMETIGDYQDDTSAMGRISAWYNAWNIAFHYPAGVGFNAARPELFAKYSPYPDAIHAAHSIYFQVLGNHGFIGLAIFLLLWLLTWRSAGWLFKHSPKSKEARWCADLGSMCQVSLLGFAVGGAFLSLSYFDLTYDIMVLVVATRVWVQSRGWEREPIFEPGWRALPGLATTSKSA
ncbi:MAG: putative O-glycosylation ligase, exosortase A system-associated [Ramlibacter sp.]|nr:putative O-glycosylation ligase, exosortase A system-associated [Ramlibacter sp.]